MKKLQAGKYNSYTVNQNFVDKRLSRSYPRLTPPGVCLTKRESECFYLLSRVVTIKKIAKILELSPRTVEMYINQIKDKMGLGYKSELIEIAIDLVSKELGEEHLNVISENIS